MTLAPDQAFAGLADLARLGAVEAPPARVGEQAGALLLRVTGAGAVRISVESQTGLQVLFASWPQAAETWRSRVSLPLVSSGRSVGLIECAAPAEGFCDPSRRRFLEAAAAILARLLDSAATDLTQNVLELRSLQRVAEAVSRSIDLDEVLGRCLEMALEVAHAPAGAIYLRDGQRGVYRRVQRRNLPDQMAPLEFPARNTDRHFAEGKPRIIDVAARDTPADMMAAAREAGFERVVVVPLRVENRTVGLLGLDFYTTATFLPATLRTIEAIAGQEAIAIENARVHQQAEVRARLAQTLRQFAERALAVPDEKDLYRLILETACAITRSDRGLISRLSSDGRSARVTAALGKDERLLGWDIQTDNAYVRDSLESETPLVVEDTSTLAPESLFAQVAKQNATASFVLIAMRYRGQPLGHLFTASGEPRRYEAAEVEAMQLLSAMSAEVLERARSQREANEERCRLDGILEHLPVVIAVIDRSGKVVTLNRAAREFSETFNTATGKRNWHEGAARVRTFRTDGSQIPPEDRQITRAFMGEHPGQREILLVSEDGKKKMHALSVAAPLLTQNGQVQQVVTAFQDVSALRALADAKDRFLRVASHELRSPITSLRATTSLLEMDPEAIANPERRAVMLQRIQRQVDRLIKLVEQLLDSARINAQQVPIEPVDCELGQIADEAVAMAAPAPEERARVSVIRPGPVRGAWDPLRLEQVLTNLISNALRYSPAGAPVELRLVEGEPVRIEVVDRGIGIPPDQLDQVFSPFFRGTNAQAQHKGGLGLGLHITSEIVRRHGGRIHVQSALGQGSTFTVELPRKQT
jgi:signal transduction histidine kinase